MNQASPLTNYMLDLYGQSHGKTRSQMNFETRVQLEAHKSQDWLGFWADMGTSASSRLLEVTMWQAADWQEEELAMQMLLQFYGQEEEYLFGVEWIAENLGRLAMTMPEQLGNCFDFWASIPIPMTVNQAVLLAHMIRDEDALGQREKDTIRENLEHSEIRGQFEFVSEW